MRRVSLGSADPRTATQGERRIHGCLEVIGNTPPLGGRDLTLRLSKGLALSFVASNAGSDYTIAPTGSLT